MRRNKRTRLHAGPQTAGAEPVKFWNIASTGDSGGTSVAGASLSAAVRRAAIVAEVEKTIKEGDKDKHENE